jgi:hypothetical protein
MKIVINNDWCFCSFFLIIHIKFSLNKLKIAKFIIQSCNIVKEFFRYIDDKFNVRTCAISYIQVFVAPDSKYKDY